MIDQGRMTQDTWTPTDSLAVIAGLWEIREFIGQANITGVQWFIPADPQRWSIFLTAGSLPYFFVISNPPAGATAWGLNAPSNGDPLELNYRDHGALVQLAWGGFSTGLGPSAPRAICVTWKG